VNEPGKQVCEQGWNVLASGCLYVIILGMNETDLARFIEAQESPYGSYQQALQEIRDGRKQSHWVWYIFPQLRGLGTSDMAYVYGISGLDEAHAYLNHPKLSGRLQEFCVALLQHKDKSAYEILGDIDAMKLRSSMTLFALISEGGSIYHNVLDCFYNGKTDSYTIELI
jgi:uncharacterized protein (DUF1810 family)